MVSAPLRIKNADARRLWLDRQGMAAPPNGALGRAELTAIIERLGMVQLDPLKVVARAHDHILWSRNANYRPAMLERALARDRAVFEHYTHDACVLPISIYPLWQRQKERLAARYLRGSWGKHVPDRAEQLRIRDRIAQEGPLSSRDFDGKADKRIDAWLPPPHRLALDLMWRKGELATSHRQNFSKFFDLEQRVIPVVARGEAADDPTQLDWLCRSALDRLGFGTPQEIAKFYDAADLGEIRTRLRDQTWHLPVQIEAADGTWSDAFAPPDIESRLASTTAPSSRIRIVNPFDPIARDRARAKRLFGFDYRIEIYTPAAKRQYGYYIYPLLEGARFVGRLELRIDAESDALIAVKLWPEPGLRFGVGRMGRLHAEMQRMARFAGVSNAILDITPV